MLHSHPNYGNPDKPSFNLPFAIYSSVSQNTFNAALSTIESHDLLEACPPAYPPESSVPEIIAFHRGLCSTSNPIVHPLLLIIVDKDDFNQSGVLLVNLGASDDLPWKVDYMRHPIHDAEAVLATIAIGQTDWEETLDNAQFGLQWDRYFAKYPTHPSFGNYQEFWDVDREFRKALEGPERQRFRTWQVREDGELCGGEDVADVAHLHLITAEASPQYQQDLFVWFDLDLWNTKKGIMIVKMMDSSVQGIRRLPVTEAANLLVDVAMGLREW